MFLFVWFRVEALVFHMANQHRTDTEENTELHRISDNVYIIYSKTTSQPRDRKLDYVTIALKIFGHFVRDLSVPYQVLLSELAENLSNVQLVVRGQPRGHKLDSFPVCVNVYKY